MLQGKESRILAERCSNGIKEIRVAKPKAGSPVLKFNRNTKRHIYDATTIDNYEKKMVYVKNTAKSEDGLFAKRDIKPNEIVAYYSGTIWTPKEHITELSPANQTGYFR